MTTVEDALAGFVLALALPRPAHHAAAGGMSVREVAGLTLMAAGFLAAARQLRRASLGIAPLYAGLSLMVLGFVVSTTVLVALILCAISLALLTAAGIQLLVYYRQIGAFLAAQGGRV